MKKAHADLPHHPKPEIETQLMTPAFFKPLKY